jgi:hypothetical protein
MPSRRASPQPLSAAHRRRAARALPRRRRPASCTFCPLPFGRTPSHRRLPARHAHSITSQHRITASHHSITSQHHVTAQLIRAYAAGKKADDAARGRRGVQSMGPADDAACRFGSPRGRVTLTREHRRDGGREFLIEDALLGVHAHRRVEGELGPARAWPDTRTGERRAGTRGGEVRT